MIKKFRPGQREIMETSLRGENVIGILPTGAGKSLCFQVPGLLIPGMTVVVSPLLSLMQDQVSKLKDAGLDTSRLDSTVSAREQSDTMERVKDGEAEFIYVTPERLENPECIASLKDGGVSLFVVDEAHCISQWGHDFRPAYLSLRNAHRALGSPRVIALTATARPDVVQDIVRQLGLSRAIVVDGGIERPNLEFRVVRTVNDERKRDHLVEILQKSDGAGIVYVATTKAADELKDFAVSKGLNVERYHGKMKASERRSVQENFMNGQYRAIVATKAFGLGIDKQDTRFVVHYHFPDSLESYYQEAGRAGRDGKAATATLLYRLEDKRIQSFFLGGKYPSRKDSRAVYAAVRDAAKQGERITQTEIAERTEIGAKRVSVILALLESAEIVRRGRTIRMRADFETEEAFDAFLGAYEQRHSNDRSKLDMMMRYGQTTECRMKFMKSYFGYTDKDDCGVCDNCRVEVVPVPLPPSQLRLSIPAEAAVSAN